MKRQLTAPLLAAVVLAAGCGGSSGAPDADPAAMVPATAPVYVEATLKPDEETSGEIRTLSQKLAGTDEPGAELKKLFEQAVNEDGGGFSWDEDVEPWAGDRLGFFATSFGQGADGELEGAFVMPTSDADKARTSLERDLAEKDKNEPAPKIVERTHQDVAYKVDTTGKTAVAVVDDYALLGSEGGVKAAIDASKGDGLESADAFQRAKDQVQENAVGFGYVRFEQLLSTLGPQAAMIKPLLGQLGETLAFTLDTDSDAIRLETAMLGVKGKAAATGPGSVLAGLPGDAWAAGGVADVGAQIEQALAQIGQLGAFGGFDLDQVLQQVEQASGIDVRKDLIAWMGDAGLFVRGTSIADIGGALVVRSKDAAATKAVLPKLQRFVRAADDSLRVRALSAAGVDEGFTVRAQALPLPIHVAAAGDRFIIAVTDGALEAAIKPAATLASAQGYKDAAAKLGDGVKPSLFLDVAPVKALVDGLGGAQQDPAAAKALGVLGKLSTIAAGGQREGDVQRGRLVVGVK